MRLIWILNMLLCPRIILIICVSYLARAVFLMLRLCFLAAAISLKIFYQLLFSNNDDHQHQHQHYFHPPHQHVEGYLRESPKSWPDKDSPSERSPIVPGTSGIQLLCYFYFLISFDHIWIQICGQTPIPLPIGKVFNCSNNKWH